MVILKNYGEPIDDCIISLKSNDSVRGTWERNNSDVSPHLEATVLPSPQFSTSSASNDFMRQVCVDTPTDTMSSSRTNGINARLLRPGAKKITFLRNGYRYFNGIIMSISPIFYRSYEVLLQEITRRMHKHVTLHGPIIVIFSVTGQKMTDIDEFQNGQTYFCATKKETFKPFEYSVTHTAKVKLPNSYDFYRERQRTDPSKRKTSPPVVSLVKTNVTGPHSRIISLICSGNKPRRIVRFLLSPRTAHSFNQLLSDISDKVRLESGAVRKIYTSTGKLVEKLSTFYKLDNVFLVFGHERVNFKTDFILHEEERALLTKQGTKPAFIPEVSTNNSRSSKKTSFESSIPIHTWPVVLRSQYRVCEVIGRGEFSTVFKVLHRPSTKFYALKVVEKYVQKTRQFADNERNIHQLVNHEYILSLIKSYEHRKCNYLLTAFMEDGDLFKMLDQHPEHRLDLSQTKLIIKQLGEALVYLHKRLIVHRDVKPENILVETDGNDCIRRIKLADFGLACIVYNRLYTMCGSVLYIAPEVLMHVGYGRKVDIWATGALMYMLLHGFPPFEPESSLHNDRELYRKIRAGRYIVDPGFDDSTCILLCKLMERRPHYRYTAEDLINDEWFNDGVTTTTEYTN